MARHLAPHAGAGLAPAAANTYVAQRAVAWARARRGARLPRARAAGRTGGAAKGCRRTSRPSTAPRRRSRSACSPSTVATARPAPLRAHLAEARVVHFPLTIAVPRMRQPRVVTLHDMQHLDLPGLFSRTERAFRAVAWHRSLRGAGARDRAQRVRPRTCDRRVSASMQHESASSTRASITRASRRERGEREPFLLLSRARLAAQEPRAGCSRRSRCSAASGPSCGSSSRAAVTATCRTASRRAATCRRTSCAALSHGRGARLPVALRGLRPAAARGDGVRLPRRLLERRVPAGDRRRRGAALRPARSGSDRRRGRATCSPRPSRGSQRGLARAARFSWDATARETDAVYAELL